MYFQNTTPKQRHFPVILFFCHPLPMNQPSLLALQVSHQPLNSSLDVLSIMAIAWTLDKIHTSPVRTREKTEEGAERGGSRKGREQKGEGTESRGSREQRAQRAEQRERESRERAEIRGRREQREQRAEGAESRGRREEQLAESEE